MSNILNALSQASGLSLADGGQRTSTPTLTAIDVLDYEGSALIVLNSGAATAGSSPTLNVKIQHSDASGSGFADVSGATFEEVTGSAGTAGIQVMKVNVSNLKRYLKAVATVGGTSTPTFAFSIDFIGVKKTT